MTQYSKPIEVTKVQNRLVRQLIDSEIAAYKNWIRRAVEQKEFARAEQLSKELQLYEQMRHVFIPDDMWDVDFRTQKIERRIT